MPLIVVHLRWDEVRPEQYEQLCRALPDGPQRPPGCLHRRRRRQGRAVLAIEAWADEQQAAAHLATLPAPALGRPPHHAEPRADVRADTTSRP